MKNRIVRIFLVLLLIGALMGTASAETFHGSDGWHVVFTIEDKMVSNFSPDGMSEILNGLQPGDNAIFTVELANESEKNTDWYLSNKVLYSLEDRSNNEDTAGGAYAYDLTYIDVNGAENVLFSSDTVGGETVTEAGEGLHEAASALEDFFYLDTLTPGQKGKIVLEVTLEGETQGNDYQDTLADLSLNFAVEAETVGQMGEPPTIVKTGDNNNLMVYYIIMAVSGVLFLALAVDNVRRRRKERKKVAG